MFYDRKTKDGPALVKANTPRILDPNNYRPFWISWANGRVTVGEGLTVGEQTFLDYVDTSPVEVHYISLSGKTKAGTFLIDKGILRKTIP